MICSFLQSKDPTKTAVITETGKAVSYASLNHDVNEISGYLTARNLIFIIGQNDYNTLLLYLAALKAGAVPLILNADAQISHALHLIDKFSPQFIFSKTDSVTDRGSLQTLLQKGSYSLYRNEAFKCPKLHDDLAFLIATSGSTGDPKLVKLTRENLESNAASISEYLDISPDDRAIASLPISYSYGLSVVNSHLYAGASIVLSNYSLMEKQFWQQIEDHQVTSFSGVPYHYEMLLRLRLERLKIPSIQKMTQAGGRLAPDKIKKIDEYCQANDIKFWTMYGQTEASPRISYLPYGDTTDKAGSIGHAIPNGKLWIKNEDGKDITQSGEIGELVYEGPNVCLGYATNIEELSKGDENQATLATGDLARCDSEGYFYLEGRLRRFLKLYGTRISLDQVEEIIQQLGVECAAHGADDKMVIHIVATDDYDIKELKRKVSESIGINMAAISIHVISKLPRLAAGKVDYQCLKQTLLP